MADAADISHGIESITFQTANTSGENAGQFPDFASGVTTRDFKLIQIDSVTEDKDDDTVEDIMVEDMDDPLLQLTTEKGRKTFNLVSYDLSPESLKYWLGDKLNETTEDPNNGYYVNNPSFELPLQAIKIVDKKVAGYAQRQWEYMPVKVIAKVTGTRGKSGLLTLSLSGTLLGNKDKNGNVIGNYRHKVISE